VIKSGRMVVVSVVAFDGISVLIRVVAVLYCLGVCLGGVG